MRSHWAEQRGSVTAEFAMALPAIMLVLAVCLNAVAAVGVRVQLIDQSQIAARMLGRGEAMDAVQARFGTVTVSRDAPLLCVSLRRQVGALPVQARSCALDGGW